jgi:DNA polymerase-3 subunit epsilon
MTRELVLDTETTGLDHDDGHRIVEIGIIELENHLPTGNYFHYYLNPERDSDNRAKEVHGLSREFLKDKPKFSEIAEEFINYISDSKIIIHNASFDVGFLNAELTRCNMKELNNDIIIDTLVLAKRKFIGQSVSLDSLCRKYNIDLTGREIHGAIKDAKLLASVYLELIGGRQSKLDFEIVTEKISSAEEKHLLNIDEYYKNMSLKKVNHFKINEEDYKLHLKSIQTIKDSIWEKINN